MAAVVAATLGFCVSGALGGVGAAWSQGPLARTAGSQGHRHGHHSGGATGGSGTRTQVVTTTVTTVTTTTTPSTTTTSTTTAATTSAHKNSAPPVKKPQPQPKPKPKPKPVVLTATLAGTTSGPEHELGVWSSSPRQLTASQVHVTENGQPVSGLTLRPLSDAGSKAFGVIVLLDESSALSFDTRGTELSTAAAIAERRTGQEQFGVIAYNAVPSVLLPLSSNPVLIGDALRTPPVVAPGGSVLPALSMAYSELHKAGLATGAVIVVTAGKNLASPGDEAAMSQAGLRLGYQTVSTDVLANGISSQAPRPGQDGDVAQEQAFAAQLGDAGDIWSRLASGYLATYRSVAKPGQHVTVSVSADGLTGSPTMTYTATQQAAAPTPSVPPLSQLPVLMHQPSFAQFVPASAPVVPQHPTSSFWTSQVSLITVSVLCALLLAGALWLLMGGIGRSQLENRVASFIPEAPRDEDEATLALSTAPGAPPFLARRRWWPSLVLQADVGRFRRSPVGLVKLTAIGSITASLLLTLILGSLAGFLIGLPLGPLVLWVMLRRAVRRTRERFADQVPSSLQDMSGAVRGGRSLAGAISAVTDGAEEPILGEFERVIADEQLGRPLEDSLHTVAQRMKSEDMEQVALVATLHRRSGSSVSEALDHVAEGARERSELIRELKSLTGQARLSSRILTGLPVALLVALSVLEPHYMYPVLHTTAGIVVVVFCGFMVFLGWLALRRLVKVEA